MKKLEILTFPNTYEKTQSSLVGKIYIKLDCYTFPNEEWTDFVENVVNWWMENFTKLLFREERKVRCSFMDGNYRFDIEAVSDEIWHLSLIKEWADSEEIKEEGDVNAKQATTALLYAAHQIQEMFQEKRMTKYLVYIEERKQKLLDAMQKA